MTRESGVGYWGTYHVQSDHRVKFDQSMEPAKDDRDRKEGEVRGISYVVAKVLAELAHKHPHQKRADGNLLLTLARQSLHCLPQQPQESIITKNGWW